MLVPIPTTSHLRINYGHPLGVGLRAAWIPLQGHVIDLVAGYALALKSTAAFDSPYGALRCNAAGEGAELTIPTALQLQWPMTIVAYWNQLDVPGGGTPLFSMTANNTNSNPYVVAGILENTSKWSLFYSDGTGSFNVLRSVQASAVNAIHEWHAVGVLMDHTGIGKASTWFNGIAGDTSVAAPYSIGYSGTGTVGFGSYTGAASNPNADFLYGLIYDRGLTPDQAQWLYAEPWAWLDERPDRSYFLPSAGIAIPPFLNSYRQRRGYA